MTRSRRAPFAALPAALALAACGMLNPAGDCGELRRVGDTSAFRLIGPAVALGTTCAAPIVVVDGREYTLKDARWLDEDTLWLREVGEITHATFDVYDSAAYELRGIDPDSLLVMKRLPDDKGWFGEYDLLWAGATPNEALCSYADPEDSDAPPGCRADD